MLLELTSSGFWTAVSGLTMLVNLHKGCHEECQQKGQNLLWNNAGPPPQACMAATIANCMESNCYNNEADLEGR